MAFRKGWVEAGSLKVKDKVYDSANDTLEIEKLESEKLDDPVIVYNFEAEDYHTYYVGEHTILVHNSCAKPTTGGNRPPNMSPKGSGRTGAFKEAKRQNGVPVTEQPEKVIPNINRLEQKVPGR